MTSERDMDSGGSGAGRKASEPDARPGDSPAWPKLPFESWEATRYSLHMWTQIVGKVRMELSPWINHSWGVTLYVTARGLTTGPVPHGTRTFQLDFDLVDHRLVAAASDGVRRELPLRPRSVASFHEELLETLGRMGLGVSIDPDPQEIEDPIAFPEDHRHRSYDPDHATAMWRAFVQADRVFREFRARFIGKCSPVHYFWGAMDLAVTRFSGRKAPEHPGGIPNLPDEITREAYSHEVSSAGFYPGNPDAPEPFFYSYAYPEPDGFRVAEIDPDVAAYSEELGEWVLPYGAVRSAGEPDALLLAFLQSTYDAAADLADWDRDAFERPAGWRPL